MHDGEGRQGGSHAAGEFRDADVACVTVEALDSLLHFAACDHRASTEYVERALIRGAKLRDSETQHLTVIVTGFGESSHARGAHES